MAANIGNILTNSLNLKIVKTIPLIKIEAVFVELGFDMNDIEKRGDVAQMSSKIFRLFMDLLSSRKDRLGCGLDEAEELKEAMQKHDVADAVKLIQKAIDRVIPNPPQQDLQSTTEASSTSMAANIGNIITESLNLEIVKTIPLNKIEAVFVELGFSMDDIEKRGDVAQMTVQIFRLIIDLLSSRKDRLGCGLDEAEKLKEAMKKHDVVGAVKLIQKAIDEVIPVPPQLDHLMEASSPSTSDKLSLMDAQDMTDSL